VTDWVKTNLVGVPIETPWGEMFQTWPGVFLAAFAVVALVLALVLYDKYRVAAWWLARRRLPSADQALAFSADAHQPMVRPCSPQAFTAEQVRSAVASEAKSIVDVALVEKTILITLVSLSFAQVLPNVQRGFGWAFTLGQFVVMAAVNLGLILAYALLRSRLDASVSTGNALFFALLLTLLVTLFDHYRQVYLMHFSPVLSLVEGPKRLTV
jgi:hypothetical protein